MRVREATRRDAPTGVHRWRWIALGALLAAEAMNLLDATIVQVAAPVIHRDLGGAESAVQWFSAAYTLPFAVLLITGGRLGDMLGRRRVFAVGTAAFAVASVCCALAPGTGALVAARTVQGAAAALVIPQTIGLIRAMFDGAEMAKALGTIGPVMGLSAVCGPVLGSVLTHAVSWRAAFLVNVPIAVLVLAAVPALREDRAAEPPRLDAVGTVLAVAGAGLVVYPLIQGDTAGWPLWTWGAMAAGVAVLVGFGFQQRRAARRGRGPLVEPSLFRDRGFPAALATSTLLFAAVNGLTVVIVLQVQMGLGRDVLSAGLTLLPWSGALAVSSLAAGARLVPRYGNRVLFAGLGVLLAGVLAAVAVYHWTRPGSYPWALPGALALAGAGNGLATVPFFTAALSRVRPHETGSAAGLLNAVQQFGGTLGVALLGSAFFHVLDVPPARTSLDAAQVAFWLAAGLLVATAGAAAVMAGARGRS
ncbi:MFS transporter [Actinomadura fibrosa]|uniref:MFS transporter n=1 Tax=Actinomadura fibrosa TaxID=111802 RepID=A0ABW2XBM5_9ACTN|nr:MFS transporter [Actinomadura fibrosa]